MLTNSPNPTNVSFTNGIKSCPVCGGAGSLVIRNAYDLDFEAIEICEECKGSGYIVSFSDSSGSN